MKFLRYESVFDLSVYWQYRDWDFYLKYLLLIPAHPSALVRPLIPFLRKSVRRVVR